MNNSFILIKTLLCLPLGNKFDLLEKCKTFNSLSLLLVYKNYHVEVYFIAKVTTVTLKNPRSITCVGNIIRGTQRTHITSEGYNGPRNDAPQHSEYYYF